ncbi:hypothetical protein BAY59_27545 [Prauserella coralliicola]|nr:hypothetical protein BAY59_27545 [Prauserella coralliicola]
MSATAATTELLRPKKVAVEVIDSDVHLLAKDGIRTVWEYIPVAWQERFAAKGVGLRNSAVGVSAKTMRFTHPTGAGIRTDAVSPAGGPPGSDHAFVTRQLLEDWDVDIAIVNAIDSAAYAAALAGPDEATVICEAYNRYFVEEWIAADSRYRYLLTANPQDPIAAATEIRRAGRQDGVVGVFLPPTNVLFGNRYYNPIWEAASDLGLPVWTHVTGIEYVHQGSALPAGGFPESYAERRTITAQIAESNVASLAFSGVLERYPDLKVCFSEFGFTWLLSMLWRMDDTWRACRRDTPWVRKPPSEYVHDRIRFTTQPLDEPADPRHLLRLIDMLGADLLLFSSDYPHWDNDNPHRVLNTWPHELRDQVCGANPRAFWPL